jgi:hypothetical protein
MKRIKKHNPEKVNSAFIPKGWELIPFDKIGTKEIKNKVRIWIAKHQKFSETTENSGTCRYCTYIWFKGEKQKNASTHIRNFSIAIQYYDHDYMR